MSKCDFNKVAETNFSNKNHNPLLSDELYSKEIYSKCLKES